jgi:hypothetical protein
LSPKIGEVVEKEMEKLIDTCNVGVKLDKVEELAQQRVVDITVEEAASVVLGKGKQLFLCKSVRMIELFITLHYFFILSIHLSPFGLYTFFS